MKIRIAAKIFCILCILSVGDRVEAGFQDFLKNLMKPSTEGRQLTEAEIVDGLKQALQVGTEHAVAAVSKTDGYFKNPRIKILLPQEVQQVEAVLRTAGFGNQVDAFELSMNRAAERAAAEAKPIFWDAIKQMSFSDAKGILNGPDNAATLYFKNKTSGRLRETFRPIVHRALSEVGTTGYYQSLNARIKTIPFADQFSFDLDRYVTDKALDGLFFMLAAEEKKIREDPAARVTELLQKVFGRQ